MADLNAGGILRIEPDPADIAAITEMLRELPRELPKVIARSLNDAGRTVRSRIVKAAAKRTGLKQKIIRARVWPHKAKASKLVHRVIGGKVGWPMVLIKYRETAHGITVRIAGQTERLEHAFVARMPSGHVGIFERLKKSRLPIFEQKTDSVTEAIAQAAGLPDVLRAGSDMLAKRLPYHAGRALERAAKRAARKAGGTG